MGGLAADDDDDGCSVLAEMQKTEYMVFAGRQYFLGDKCQVTAVHWLVGNWDWNQHPVVHGVRVDQGKRCFHKHRLLPGCPSKQEMAQILSLIGWHKPHPLSGCTLEKIRNPNPGTKPLVLNSFRRLFRYSC